MIKRIVFLAIAVVLAVVLFKSFGPSNTTIALHNDGTEILSVTSCTSEPVTLQPDGRADLTVPSGKTQIGCDVTFVGRYQGCLVVATKKESSTEVELSSADKGKSQSDCQSFG